MKKNVGVRMLMLTLALIILLAGCKGSSRDVTVSDIKGSWQVMEIKVDGEIISREEAYQIDLPIRYHTLTFSNVIVTADTLDGVSELYWELSDGKIIFKNDYARGDFLLVRLTETQMVLGCYMPTRSSELNKIEISLERLGPAPEGINQGVYRASWKPFAIKNPTKLLTDGYWGGRTGAYSFEEDGTALVVEYVGGYWQHTGEEWSWDIDDDYLTMEYGGKEGEIATSKIVEMTQNIIVLEFTEDDYNRHTIFYRCDEYGRTWMWTAE